MTARPVTPHTYPHAMFVNIEVSPDYCPNGHRLGPNRVLLGWEPGTPGWRTYICTRCRAVIRIPSDQINHAWIKDGTKRPTSASN